MKRLTEIDTGNSETTEHFRSVIEWHRQHGSTIDFSVAADVLNDVRRMAMATVAEKSAGS